ncbi:Nuclear RNA export factor 1 [Brachionus plicatilis]|uniref:Nuclear RNA export factor 1 n=1 Tax=Brachionus plicatilis TaxID=10195 RepID=A0A3M7T7N9_BRAPC|nr:Nuclear RNA export factor 1 [Brachionus plicatilis]
MNTSFEDNRQRYHGKRRNAFVGNIRYRPQRQVENGDNRTDDASNINRALHNRIRGGSLKHRLSRPASHPSSSKYKIIRTIRKDAEGDDIMVNNEGTSNQLARAESSHYRVRNKTFGRRFPKGPNKETKSYAIGEKENGYKPFSLSFQSHCKLKCLDQNVFDLIVNFLQQYFNCYDSNREELLAAYHKSALFSLSLNVNSQASFSNQKFGSYFKDSRNQIYVTGNEKLFKLLHSGNLDIVSFLSKMPKTEHDSSSFKLDSCFFLPNMISFSITGLLKEGEPDQKNRPLRSFQRVFVCVPTQTGQMSIVNEQYTISNPSKSQTKGKIEATTSEPMVPEVAPIDPVLAQISDPNQRNKIVEFSKFSNLNYKWSKDCLEFSKWDYELAKNAFLGHKAEIPPNAFL